MKRTIELVTRSEGSRVVQYLENDKGCKVGELLLARHAHNYNLPTDVPDGTKITITIDDIPRQKGWYPAIMNDESKKLIYWNGEEFRSGTGNRSRFTCTWDEDEYKWVADNPIPDPFDEVKDEKIN